jgi:diamine N-acetyltransferase
VNEPPIFQPVGHIKPLTADDVASLRRLATDIWHAHYARIISSAQIEYMLEHRYNEALVRSELRREDLWWDKLLVDECMAGFSSYFVIADAPVMKLDKLYVHGRYQRKGFGGLMLRRACETARNKNCRTLRLTVNKRNDAAVAAYAKHGFKVTASIVQDIGGGFVMDDFVMERTV